MVYRLRNHPRFVFDPLLQVGVRGVIAVRDILERTLDAL